MATVTFYLSVKSEVYSSENFVACINPVIEYDFHGLHQQFIDYMKSQQGATDVVFALVFATAEEAKLNQDMGYTDNTTRVFQNEEIFFCWLTQQGWKLVEKDSKQTVHKFGHRKNANLIFAAIERTVYSN